MPWWMSFIFLAAGWGFKILYDWKIQPAITKSHKKSEKREVEKEERTKRAKEEKINAMNRTWKNERAILQNLKQPLREFNQMNRFHDSRPAVKCMELASKIETETEKIQHPEFQEIKKQLLEYARRKDHIDQNTGLKPLMNLFQKLVEPNKYEPLLLCEEIDNVLKIHSTPPYSEKDL